MPLCQQIKLRERMHAWLPVFMTGPQQPGDGASLTTRGGWGVRTAPELYAALLGPDSKTALCLRKKTHRGSCPIQTAKTPARDATPQASCPLLLMLSLQTHPQESGPAGF